MMRIAQEQKRQVIQKILNVGQADEENKAKRDKLTDLERKEKDRMDRMTKKVACPQQKFGDNEQVVRYVSTREGTGLIIPKYCDYTSLLLPQFYGNQKPHASGTHHSQHLEDRAKQGLGACDSEGCSSEAIYRLPRSHKKACSLACFKLLRQHRDGHVHHQPSGQAAC